MGRAESPSWRSCRFIANIFAIYRFALASRLARSSWLRRIFQNGRPKLEVSVQLLFVGYHFSPQIHLRTFSPLGQSWSKQKIPLRHWQHLRRLAGQQLAVRPDAIGIGVDFDLGCRGVIRQVLFGDIATALDCDGWPLE